MKRINTLAVTYSLVAVAAAWEFYTLCNDTSGDTFSATLSEVGETQTVIPAFCGALCRHLWRSPKAKAAFWVGYAAGETWPLIDGQQLKGEKTHDA